MDPLARSRWGVVLWGGAHDQPGYHHVHLKAMMTPPPRRAQPADYYWGRAHGHPTVTPTGMKAGWGAFMDAIAAGKRVLIMRARYSGRASPTLAAVAVPYTWWLKQTKTHGAPAVTDTQRVTHFRSVSEGHAGMSVTLDWVEDKRMHVQLQRQRDMVAVLVPGDWYEQVTGKSITERV